MTYKNYIKGLLIFVIIILIFSLINTLFYYFDIYNSCIVKIIGIASLIISSFFSGYFIGITSKNKGYVSGLLLSGIIIGISLLLRIVIIRNITLMAIGGYLLMLIIITGSSIVGINKKNEETI